MISRCRIFAAVWLGGLALIGFATDAPVAAQLTARQIVARIQQESHIKWHTPTVDTFKAGDPDAPVTGTAVTMMATLDVLQRAAAGGSNFIITHEPTFYGHLDLLEPLASEHDPVLAAKQEFIKAHGLVIWRFHDHIHAMNPDMITAGVLNALGWTRYQNQPDRVVLVIPETKLEDLAAQIKARMGIKALRMVGDPPRKITQIGFSPGFSGFDANRKLLQDDHVQVLVFGEAHEWETIEYGVDAVTAGKDKALIILGHIPSEQAGMQECTRWLKTFVTEVPIQFVSTPEPFWTVK